MTIAFDASSVSAGTDTGDFSWTHTPVGTPRGVLVIVIQEANGADQVNGVTYGGVAMSEVSDSPFLWTASIDDAVLYGYFLGASVPTGAQTVAVDVDATGSVKKAVAITVTAANDTSIEDTGTTGTSNGSNPSVAFTTTRDTIVFGGMHTGNAVLSAVSAGSGFTEIAEVDWGPNVSAWARSTSVESAGSFSRGWTSTGGTSQAALGVAIAEVVALSVAVGQATETDTAGVVAWAPKRRMVGQALETDTAQTITPDLAGQQIIPAAQAIETDTAQPIGHAKTARIGQTTETDTGQAVGHAKTARIGQAAETDTAQPVAVPQPPPILGLASELDRAQQITVIGGSQPISSTSVLIRAPSRAGRIFHEIELRGDTYHPNIAGWSAEEEAPGGFGPSTGRISERVFRAHRELFRAGANWFVYHEDGTCLHAGRLLEPDTSEGEVQLTDRGVSSLAEREVGPVLYQAHVGSELSVVTFESDRWSVAVHTMPHSFSDTAIVFDRSEVSPASGNASIFIPFFGRDLAYLRMHMQGQASFVSVQTRQRVRIPSNQNSSELDVDNSSYENWYFNLEAGPLSSGQVEVDLVVKSDGLSYPNTTDFTNPDVGALGFVYPDVIHIEVGDWADTTGNEAQAHLELSNIEVNGVALGEKRAFSAHDLVADIAALIGLRYTQIEGGSFDVTPYELPPGTPAAEALDYASLLSGKRWRIIHNGNHPVMEFGSYGEHVWGLASPWAPFDAIPQDLYDAVAVPYQYPGTHGQLTDQVIVKLKDSPLDRRNIYWDLGLPEPAHNQDRARALGGRVGEEMVRKRNAGTFAAAELLGPDGMPTTAHHANAGDSLYPMRPYDEGRLHISHLTRFDDHIEGTFDGANHALEKMLARREKKMSRR